jgi:hypothetical protein
MRRVSGDYMVPACCDGLEATLRAGTGGGGSAGHDIARARSAERISKASAVEVIAQVLKEFEEGKAKAEKGASKRVAEVQKEARQRVTKVSKAASKTVTHSERKATKRVATKRR